MLGCIQSKLIIFLVLILIPSTKWDELANKPFTWYNFEDGRNLQHYVRRGRLVGLRRAEAVRQSQHLSPRWCPELRPGRLRRHEDAARDRGRIALFRPHHNTRRMCYGC